MRSEQELPPEPAASPVRSGIRKNSTAAAAPAGVHSTDGNAILKSSNVLDAMEEDAPLFDYGVDSAVANNNSGGSSFRTNGDAYGRPGGSNNNFDNGSLSGNNNSGNGGKYSSLTSSGGLNSNNNTFSSAQATFDGNYRPNGYNSNNNNSNLNSFQKNNNFNGNSEFDDGDDELLALDVDKIVNGSSFSSQPQPQHLQSTFGNNHQFVNNDGRVPLRSISGDQEHSSGYNGNTGYNNSNSFNCEGGHKNASTFGESYDSNFNSTNYGDNGGGDANAPPCPGHNVPCRVLTAQTASNNGRQFYKCSLPGEMKILYYHH